MFYKQNVWHSTNLIIIIIIISSSSIIIIFNPSKIPQVSEISN